MNEVEIKTVDTLLDKGVRVQIPAPFFFRLFGCKTVGITVRRPTLGNMLRISRMYLKMDIPEGFGENFGDWTQLFVTHSTAVSRIVAMGMLRGKLRGWLLCRPLANYLRWRMDTREMATLAGMLVTLSGVQDFLNTIRFLGTMKMTSPRNLSQE